MTTIAAASTFTSEASGSKRRGGILGRLMGKDITDGFKALEAMGSLVAGKISDFITFSVQAVKAGIEKLPYLMKKPHALSAQEAAADSHHAATVARRGQKPGGP